MAQSDLSQVIELHHSPYTQAGRVWFWKDLDDGRVVWVFPMMYNARIGVGLGSMGTLDDGWCYESVEVAIRAAQAWEGEGEPEGWHRHPGSGRRRPGGDPAQEFVAP